MINKLYPILFLILISFNLDAKTKTYQWEINVIESKHNTSKKEEILFKNEIDNIKTNVDDKDEKEITIFANKLEKKVTPLKENSILYELKNDNEIEFKLENLNIICKTSYNEFIFKNLKIPVLSCQDLNSKVKSIFDIGEYCINNIKKKKKGSSSIVFSNEINNFRYEYLIILTCN